VPRFRHARLSGNAGQRAQEDDAVAVQFDRADRRLCAAFISRNTQWERKRIEPRIAGGPIRRT
jgi:hypothetical protein